MKFIYGEEQYLIQKELSMFSKTQKTAPIFFDESDELDTIISEICTISLFDDEKYIVLKNIKALSKNVDAKELVDSLRTIDDKVKIVVILDSAKIDRKNEMIKYLLKIADVKEMKKIADNKVVDTIREIVASKGGKITNGGIISLSNRLPNNLRVIISEIDKLLLESNDITSEMIEISIGKYHVDDHFALSNSISALDNHGIITSYNKMIVDAIEPVTIISKMASTLNLAVLVSAYKEQNMPNSRIAEEIGIHVFRIKKSVDLLDNGSVGKIRRTVVELAQLDKDIKTGKVDANIALDKFILNLIK